MPRLKKPNRKAGIGIIIVGLLIVAGIITLIVALQPKTAETADTQPSFQTLLPSDSSIEDLGGWKKFTPPNGDEYYAFVDEIDGVHIRVSQQQLPDSFKDSLDAKIAEVAKAYSATSIFNAGSTKVYSGTNSQGQQSIIFTKNDLLIFIFADKEIQDSAWITYINSLE